MANPSYLLLLLLPLCFFVRWKSGAWPRTLQQYIVSHTIFVYYWQDKKGSITNNTFHPCDMCEPARKTPPTTTLPLSTHRHGFLAVFAGGGGALAVDVGPGKQCSERDEHVHGRQESEFSDDCGRGGDAAGEVFACGESSDTDSTKLIQGEKNSGQNAGGFWKTFFPNGLVKEWIVNLHVGLVLGAETLSDPTMNPIL